MISLLTRHAVVVLPLLATGLAIHVLGDFVTDDGVISLRYSRHWVEGHGIVWNPGEDPVEGYSNFSHVALGAAALALELPALSILRGVNLAALLLTALLIYALGWRHLGDRGWAAAAAALGTVHPALVFWAGSGLETALYTFAIYWAIYQAGCRGALPRWLTAVPLLLAACTRFEGFVVALALVGAHLLMDVFARPRVRLRRSMPWAYSFLIVYAIYFLWRWDYFGYPMPNSAYFKARSDSGGVLLLEFASEARFVLLPALLAPWRRMGAAGLVILLLCAAYAVGYYDVRPSISYYHRFFLPLYPGLALLAVGALWWFVRIGGGRWPFQLLAIAGLLALLGMDLTHPSVGVEPVLRRTARMNTRIVTRLRTALFLRQHVAPDQPVAVGDVGTVAYLIPHQVVDVYGLNDERFTHRYDRDRQSFTTEVFRRPPPILVMVSSRRKSFALRYGADKPLRDELMPAHYRLLRRVLSPAERYHYFIYGRPGVVGGKPGPAPMPSLEGGLAAAIDRAALSHGSPAPRRPPSSPSRPRPDGGVPGSPAGSAPSDRPAD